MWKLSVAHIWDMPWNFHIILTSVRDSKSHAMGVEPSANEAACRIAGDQVIGTVIGAIEAGIRDGSIRADIGDPVLMAFSLWAFTHGITELVIAKGADLARRGIAVPDFSNYAFQLLIGMLQQYRPS